MGKHAWATGRSPGTAYAARLVALTRGAQGADPPIRTAEPPDTESDGADPVRPRVRWHLPAAATCLVLGVVLSVVLVVLISGGLAPPVRTVTSVKSGGTDAAAMERTHLESADADDGPAASRAGPTHPDRMAMRDGPGLGSHSGPVSGVESGAHGARIDRSTAAAAGAAEADVVVVHIAGAVQMPGVVRLPVGSRVHEAVEAAGGAAPEAELSAVNLAAQVQDGQQFHIPTIEEVASGNYPVPSALAASVSGAAPESGSATGADPDPVPVNINTAAAEELSKLPGVGPVLSQRILEWRSAHGAFTSLDQLDAVAGIGPKMLQSLRGLVLF